jgi:hypothetical protein
MACSRTVLLYFLLLLAFYSYNRNWFSGAAPFTEILGFSVWWSSRYGKSLEWNVLRNHSVLRMADVNICWTSVSDSADIRTVNTDEFPLCLKLSLYVHFLSIKTRSALFDPRPLFIIFSRRVNKNSKVTPGRLRPNTIRKSSRLCANGNGSGWKSLRPEILCGFLVETMHIITFARLRHSFV